MTGRRRNPRWDERKPKVVEPKLEDVRHKDIVLAMRASVIEVLKSLVVNNRERLMRSIVPEEVDKISVAAASAFVLKTTEISLDEELNDELPDMDKAITL